jgi:putative RNA 2'-phosphotransferase
MLHPIAARRGSGQMHLDSIRRQGLVAGGRNHVHLSGDAQTAVTVGHRHGQPVVLTVAAGRMERDGHVFYRSANGVWLTETVPLPYIEDPAQPDA